MFSKSINLIVVRLLTVVILGLHVFVHANDSITNGNLAIDASTQTRIVFNSNTDGNYEIYSMNPDGTDRINISNHSAKDLHPTISKDGTLVLFHSDRDGDNEIYVMDVDGTNVVQLTHNTINDQGPVFSPDGSKIAYYNYAHTNTEIYVMDADGSNQTRLTGVAGYHGWNYGAVWSPDGSKIAYRSDSGNNSNIWIMDADGSNAFNFTNTPTIWEEGPSWSPDGNKIAFHSKSNLSDTYWEIFTMNVDGTNLISLTDSSEYRESNPSWSPDGTRLVFQSNASGDDEIVSMDSIGQDRQVLTNEPGVTNIRPWWGIKPVQALPILTATPDSIDFGVVENGITKTEQFMLKNTGTADLNISSITVSGADSLNFTGDTAAVALIPGDSVILGVSFTPGGSANYLAALNIESDGGTASIPLIGSAARVIASGNFAYVVNYTNGSVDVYNLISKVMTESIQVGLDPTEIIADPQAKRVYVANGRSGDVSVISTQTNTVISTIPIGSYPQGLAVTPDGSFVYVTNNGSANVSVIDVVGDSVLTTISVGGSPMDIAITPDGKHAYIPNFSSNKVSVIDISNNTVIKSVGVGTSPQGAAVSPDGSKVVVGNVNSSSVSFIDVSTNSVVKTIESRWNPRDMMITPDGNFLYILNQSANQPNGNIKVYDVVGDSVITSIPFGDRPLGYHAISPQGDLFYVVDTYSASISIMDVATNTFVDEITGFTNPHGIAIVSPDIEPGPSVFVLPDSINFRGGYLDSIKERSFNVSNFGTTQLTVSDIVSTGSMYTASPRSFVVEPGMFQKVTVQFEPESNGDFLHTLTIHNNDPADSAHAVTLFGVGVAKSKPIIYVGNHGSNNISVVDLASNIETGTFDIVGNPNGMAVGREGLFAYFSDYSSHKILVWDIEGEIVVDTISVGENPASISISHDGELAFVSNGSPKSISIVNLSSRIEVSRIQLGGNPQRSGQTPDGKYLYVATSSNVAVIDIAGDSVLTTIPVMSQPIGLAITLDGSAAYVANRLSSRISVIDIATNSVKATLASGTWPREIAMSPNGRFAYVANQVTDDITVIDVDSVAVVNTIPVGDNPLSVVFSSDGDHAYVINRDDDNISVIETASSMVTETIRVGQFPQQIVLVPADPVSIADEKISTPESYALLNAYPNPFNPRTHIRYSLPVESHVELIIYDIRGRMVTTLANTVQSPGWYDVIWNGFDHAGVNAGTGVYFARIQSGEYTKTIKMLYLK